MTTDIYTQMFDRLQGNTEESRRKSYLNLHGQMARVMQINVNFLERQGIEVTPEKIEELWNNMWNDFDND